MEPGNIFSGIPDLVKDEIFETILKTGHFNLERLRPRRAGDQQFRGCLGVKVSGNGNKVFLLPPYHQIASHMIYFSG